MRRVFINARSNVRSGWKALLFMLGFTLVLLPFVLPIHGVPLLQRFPWWLNSGWVTVVILVGLTFLFLKMEKRPFRSSGLAVDLPWSRECLWGFLVGVGLIGLAAAMLWASGAVVLHHQANVNGMVLLSGALIFLPAAISEELIFRGYPFQRIVEGTGPWPALLVFAFFFALTHWGNPHMNGQIKVMASLNIFLAALLLGLSYLRTGRLGLPIGIHFGWNWAQGTLLGFGVSGGQIQSYFRPVFQSDRLWLTGGPFGLEASLPGVLVCAVMVLILVRWKPIRQSNQDASINRKE